MGVFKRLMEKRIRIGKRAMDFQTVVKIIFIIMLLLALIYVAYRLGSWLLGSGTEQTESTLIFGS